MYDIKKQEQVFLGSTDVGSSAHVGHGIDKTRSRRQLGDWQTNVIMYVLYYQV